jgi:hypothetical protein
MVSSEPLSRLARRNEFGIEKIDKGLWNISKGSIGVDEKTIFGGRYEKSILTLPVGTGYFVRKGSYFFAEVHYQPVSLQRNNEISIAFFSPHGDVPTHKLHRLGIFRTDIKIPPHTGSYTVRSKFTLEKTISVLGMYSHMHFRGLRFSCSILGSDGQAKTIYSEPFHQAMFETVHYLKKPLILAKGTTLTLEANYDNSATNPANPDPSAWVSYGPFANLHEMHIFRLQYVDGIMEPPPNLN